MKLNKDTNFDTLRSTFEDVVQAEEVRRIFDDLSTIDPENGKVVENNLLPEIESCSRVVSNWLAYWVP
jgi:hypothetical protein